jgi:hypothetical protein
MPVLVVWNKHHFDYDYDNDNNYDSHYHHYNKVTNNLVSGG